MPFWTLRRKLTATVMVLVALTFGWAAVVVAVALAGAHDQATTADAIAVLGAAQYNGRPSPVFRARLDHAAALYRRGIGRHGERIGSGSALPPQGRTPRRRGRRPTSGGDHVGLARRRRPVVLGEGQPSGPARVRRLSHAAARIIAT